ETCFGLQFGHGIGVGLYESPMISRVHSLERPVALEQGMVFALETYCAASDGRSAARIEEEVVVTADGVDILTKFPAEELLVTGEGARGGTDQGTTASRAKPGTPEEAEHYLELYRRMRLIRRFEDEVQSLFQQGLRPRHRD